MKHSLLLFLLLVGLASCKKNEAGNDKGDTPGETPIFENLSENTAIITTNDGLLIRVNPADGSAETLFDFGNYNDASGFDYADGTVYIGDESNTLNAIDVATKTLKWRSTFQQEEHIVASDVQVLLKDGTCYAVGYSGILAAVNPQTGKANWAYAADPNYTGGQNRYYPTFMSLGTDKVALGSADNTLFEGERNYIYLLDRATGKQNWRLTLPEGKTVTGKIWMSANTLLVPMGNLVALDVATARVTWEKAMDDHTWGAGDPVLAGNNLLVNGAINVGFGGRLFCLDPATGNERWNIDAGMDVVGRFTPTVIDGKYVLGVYEKGTDTRANGRPFLARIDNGEKLWENDDIGMHTDATYANGKLYFFGQDFSGTNVNVGLICLDAATGKLEWINAELNGLVNKEPLVIAGNGTFRSPGLH